MLRRGLDDESEEALVMASLARLHKYVYNWSLQPISLDYALPSDTTYVACVNFYT